MHAPEDPSQELFCEPTPDRGDMPERLRTVLQEHRTWLESGRTAGRCADLRGADLRGINLRRADLRGAQFQQADLTGAQLQGADLSGADFFEADLRDAALRDANLQEADLSGARGLLGGQLGGANLAGARLPAELLKFEGLSLVAEVSKNTQSLFTSIVLVCAYTWLTIASTTDAQLLNNAAPPSSRLPILGIDIPLVRFYAAAPVLLLCLYVYFHLGLQRLWEELSDLPAIFPDGRPLDKKAYPWLLNVLVRAHSPRLAGHRSHLSRWQARISVLLAWGLVPATILVLWGRYLRGHDWIVTALHIGLVGVVGGSGAAFLRLAARTLRGSERRPFLWKKAWKDARALGAGVTVAMIGTLHLLSLGVIEGVNPELADRLAEPDIIWRSAARYSRLDVRRWVPTTLARIGYSPSAVLDDVSLSIKPANWSPSKPDLAAVKGADMEGRNLRFAKAYSAFCINAYLREADLQWSDFRDSDLRRADLRRARLGGANLRNANLEEADLRGADLRETRLKDCVLDKALLKEAILQKANLSDARLPGANLSGADLTGADLSDADLHGAILRGADLTDVTGLTRQQLETVVTDEQTRLPADLRALALKASGRR